MTEYHFQDDWYLNHKYILPFALSGWNTNPSGQRRLQIRIVFNYLLYKYKYYPQYLSRNKPKFYEPQCKNRCSYMRGMCTEKN